MQHLHSSYSGDTIAAIATPLGQGGIGIVRISGPQAGTLARRLFRSSSRTFRDFRPRVLHYGMVTDAQGEPLDHVLAVFMPGPHTFTGEDVAEFHCHGGPAIVTAVLEAALACGARSADAGEFTKRAFLNGRMDLTQAEAVAEMIAAPVKGGIRLARAKLDGELGRRIAALRQRLEMVRMKLCVAVDFPEEDVECLSPQEFLDDVEHVRHSLQSLLRNYDRARCWREGVLVVLAGQVNAGKSSLMNALLGRTRAIVTDIPGTTRDFLEEQLSFNGLPVRLVDTAGLRESGDIVEQEGVRISRDLAAQADLVLLVVDARLGPGSAEKELVAAVGAERVLLVLNKFDLLDSPEWDERDEKDNRAGDTAAPLSGCAQVRVSAREGRGLDALVEAARAHILERMGGGEPAAGDVAPNLRQSMALRDAEEELRALREDIGSGVPYDILGVRLETACAMLSEITGETTPDDILNSIFSSFCIGK
ncbi:tRNA uridine-5-carboxymethylaminomethyl(34) synthesis GTPase MnmE [Desulfovibrio psychrotolerans]|nr:tRNA uridine-5-carboxymethylaminomethyl(34) synthesis GTPase MnmE [Desulfovibrio psychrotolerans]